MRHLLTRLFLCFAVVAALSGCGYNAIQAGDERVKAAWSEVLNQYQRRADLVPNLVAAVKGYAAHEQAVLTEVTEARSRAAGVTLPADPPGDEATARRVGAAQDQLGQALSRLLVVSERYPELKADGLFRDLLVQLEGTENRIAVARGRYVEAVQGYNALIRQFPQVVTAKLFGYAPKAGFSVASEAAITAAPKVDFAPQPAR
jgi:LemA protein